jgi:hypothetical protein
VGVNGLVVSTNLPAVFGERKPGFSSEAGLFARETETDRATPTVARDPLKDRGVGDRSVV